MAALPTTQITILFSSKGVVAGAAGFPGTSSPRRSSLRVYSVLCSQSQRRQVYSLPEEVLQPEQQPAAGPPLSLLEQAQAACSRAALRSTPPASPSSPGDQPLAATGSTQLLLGRSSFCPIVTVLTNDLGSLASLGRGRNQCVVSTC